MNIYFINKNKKGVILIISLLFNMFVVFNTMAIDESLPVSISIKLERTICYGPCPSYTVEVDQNGNVTYIGREYVRQEGKRIGKVSSETVQELVNRFKAINFFSLPKGFEKKCQEKWTDHPSVILTFTYAGETRTVNDDLGCTGENVELERIREIQNVVDSALNTNQWIK